MEKKGDKKNVHYNGMNHDACVSKISVFSVVFICTPFRRMCFFFFHIYIYKKKFRPSYFIVYSSQCQITFHG